MKEPIDIQKRIQVTSERIQQLKESLKEKSSTMIDPRLLNAAKIQTESLIKDLEKELNILQNILKQ